MNAEAIQTTFTGVAQILARSTHALNELTGCETFQNFGPRALLKVDPATGELVQKSNEELADERAAMERRRRTTRWLLGVCLVALGFWRARRRSPAHDRDANNAAALANEFIQARSRAVAGPASR